MAESEGLSSSHSVRMACGFCRKRKLRCNREVPKCDSCLKFGYECQYGPPREPSKRDQSKLGGNPSHVKKFEDRLGRVENLILQTSNGKKRQIEPDELDWNMPTPDIPDASPAVNIGREQTFSSEAIRELEQTFFVYVHPSINIIHEPTYLRLTNMGPDYHPPIFLRHAMCCLAACASKTYSHLKDSLYHSARKHLQEAEIKDLNWDKVTVANAQTWIIIAVYELKECFMHRSLMSISRAVRLVQLMRLYRVDKVERLRDPTLSLIQTPEDWLEAEERRRLFWFTFLMDRYTGISMGWPTLIDRRDVRTLLPASDEAYENSTREPSMFLSDVVANHNSHHLLSTFAAQVAGVDMCCARIQDLTRLEISSAPDDWTGNTWAKSMKIESLLTGILPIPQHLAIPPGKLNPGNVFLNMGQSATIIMAHRIAKFQAAQAPLSSETILQGTQRCQEAAATIVRLMKMTSHWDIHMFHPCTAFCLYIAALVYGKAWDHNPETGDKASLRFIIDSLHSFKVATRLSVNLFQDIEQECPGMLARLNGDLDGMPLDLYKNFINSSPEPDPAPIVHHNLNGNQNQSQNNQNQNNQTNNTDCRILTQIQRTVDVEGAFLPCQPTTANFEFESSSSVYTSSGNICVVQNGGEDEDGDCIVLQPQPQSQRERERESVLFDHSDWTVDDPDIASVARYL